MQYSMLGGPKCLVVQCSKLWRTMLSVVRHIRISTSSSLAGTLVPSRDLYQQIMFQMLRKVSICLADSTKADIMCSRETKRLRVSGWMCSCVPSASRIP